MKRGKLQILQLITNFVCVILMIVLCFLGRRGLAIAVLVAAIVANLCFNTLLCCPHCGAWPRRGLIFDEYCPQCGKALDE